MLGRFRKLPVLSQISAEFPCAYIRQLPLSSGGRTQLRSLSLSRANGVLTSTLTCLSCILLNVRECPLVQSRLIPTFSLVVIRRNRLVPVLTSPPGPRGLRYRHGGVLGSLAMMRCLYPLVVSVNVGVSARFSNKD